MSKLISHDMCRIMDRISNILTAGELEAFEKTKNILVYIPAGNSVNVEAMFGMLRTVDPSNYTYFRGKTSEYGSTRITLMYNKKNRKIDQTSITIKANNGKIFHYIRRSPYVNDDFYAMFLESGPEYFFLIKTGEDTFNLRWTVDDSSYVEFRSNA